MAGRAAPQGCRGDAGGPGLSGGLGLPANSTSKGLPMTPWYGPLASLKGSEPWAPVLKLLFKTFVYNGFIRSSNQGPMVEDHRIYLRVHGSDLIICG